MTDRLHDQTGRTDCSLAPVGPLRDLLPDGANWYEAAYRGVRVQHEAIAQTIVNEARRLFNIS